MPSTEFKRRNLSASLIGDYLVEPRPGLAQEGDTGARKTKWLRKYAIERGFLWKEEDEPACCVDATRMVATKIRRRDETVDTRIGSFAQSIATAAYAQRNA